MTLLLVRKLVPLALLPLLSRRRGVVDDDDDDDNGDDDDDGMPLPTDCPRLMLPALTTIGVAPGVVVVVTLLAVMMVGCR